MNFLRTHSQALAIFGCAALVLGSFAPAADVAIYGTVSYWDAAGFEAVLMIVSAITAVVMLRLGKTSFARLAAFVMWGSLLWPYLQGLVEPEPEGFFQQATASVVDTTTGFATDIALNFVDITWGTILLALGCVAVSIGVLGGKKTA